MRRNVTYALKGRVSGFTHTERTKKLTEEGSENTTSFAIILADKGIALRFWPDDSRTDVRMSPTLTKVLAFVLTANIKEVEKQIGKQEIPEEWFEKMSIDPTEWERFWK